MTAPGVGVTRNALPPPVSAPRSGFRRWLANRSLVQRVAAGFVVSLALAGLLALIGWGVLFAMQRDFGAFSSVDAAARSASGISVGLSRIEVAVRDHLAENDPESLEEARVRHDVLDDEIAKLAEDLRDPADRAAMAEAGKRLAAYWAGIETIMDLRAERAKLVGETVESATARVLTRLEQFKAAGGVDSAAFSSDLALGVTRMRAHLVRFVERRDAGDGAEIRNLLVAAKGRLGEMNRYLWVPGTAQAKADLEALYDELERSVDRIDETLTREDAVRADALAPNAARVLELAEAVAKRAAAEADAVRAGLGEAARRILGMVIWVGGAILALGLIAMAWAGVHVARPMRGVTRALRDLAAGTAPRSLPVAAGGEIGALAGAIRAMEVVEAERAELRARAEAMHDHLFADKERAEADSAAKTDFLVNMGHELHRPLADIARHAEALMGTLHRQGMGDLAGDAERIQWSAEQMTEQIEAILDYSKIEAGVIDIEPREIDIAQLAAEVRERCASAADMNGDALAVFVAPGTGTMRSDFEKVRRILFNLVDNACKFTRNGDVTLAVERVEREGGPWLSFIVTDTGSGFSAAQADRLFRPFVRGSGAGRGAGLGLTIVAHYTAMLGGRIEVASMPGRGTRIAIHLPAAFPADRPRGAVADRGAYPLLTVADAPAD
jgi:signal transduction histidine kinase